MLKITIPKQEYGGKNYLQSDSAIALFGKIQKSVIWEDVTNRNTLKANGQRMLNKAVEMAIKITIRAFDLHRINVNVLFIDFSGYYANIQHEPCKAVLHELLEKSGLSDELRLITEDLMDEIFKTFEMDVSRFSDEDIEAMMNGKVDPFMNMGVPKELLTGEKMLAKGADIGNQLAQNIGITFPCRIDNYCKIVCGMKHQGRYSDDMHIIHRSKEVLLKVLEGVKTIAAEYGLILNEKKTHICKLSGEYRYLQMKYTLLQNGVVVRRIHPKAITRERRKLKAYKRLLDKGIVTIEEIDGYFRSWLSGNYKYMSRDQIYDMNSLYVKLFGRSVTWKKGHGRLRWLMAHPSAA